MAGFLSNPEDGGNKDGVGWKLIGFDGAPTHTPPFGYYDEQFVKAYSWDGKTLSPLFAVDFNAEKLGRPHIMRFGQEGFWARAQEPSPAE